MRYGTTCWIAACGLLTSSVAWTQTVDIPPRPRQSSSVGRYVEPVSGVSIDQLVAAALRRVPELAAARAEIDAARGELKQAGLRPNPTASADRQEELGGTDNRTMVTVEVPLDLFRRAGRVAAADRMVDVVSLSVADRERLLAAAVRERAGYALADVRNLEVTDSVLAVVRRSRDLLEARVNEGAAPALELQMFELEMRRIEAQHALLTGQVEAAFVALKAAVGLEPDAALAVRESLEAVVMSVPVDSAAETDPIDVAVRSRADVREAGARVDLAQARIDQKRREARFDVGLYGNYMKMDTGFPQRGFDATGSLVRVRGVFHNVTFGATVTVPLWNRNQGSIAAAEAERLGAERTQAGRALAVRAEIASAAARERAARMAVDVYVSHARDLARRNLDIVRESYELGRTPLFNVLQEQRRFLDAEMAFTEALSEAYQARTALRTARGDAR